MIAKCSTAVNTVTGSLRTFVNPSNIMFPISSVKTPLFLNSAAFSSRSSRHRKLLILHERDPISNHNLMWKHVGVFLSNYSSYQCSMFWHVAVLTHTESTFSVGDLGCFQMMPPKTCPFSFSTQNKESNIFSHLLFYFLVIPMLQATLKVWSIEIQLSVPISLIILAVYSFSFSQKLSKKSSFYEIIMWGASHALYFKV